MKVMTQFRNSFDVMREPGILLVSVMLGGFLVLQGPDHPFQPRTGDQAEDRCLVDPRLVNRALARLGEETLGRLDPANPVLIGMRLDVPGC